MGKQVWTVEWLGQSQTHRTWQFHTVTRHRRGADCLKVRALLPKLEFATALSARHLAVAFVTTSNDRDMLLSYSGLETSGRAYLTKRLFDRSLGVCPNWRSGVP